MANYLLFPNIKCLRRTLNTDDDLQVNHTDSMTNLKFSIANSYWLSYFSVLERIEILIPYFLDA